MNRIHVPYVPHLVHIETTYACNQNCMFCYNPNRSMVIDTTKVDAIVKKVYDSWIPHVYLIGGEPSLLGVDKLNEYIELLSNRSSVTIVTNGQVYLDGLSTKLASLGVPIHGVGWLHDEHAKKKGSFEIAKASIKKYIDRGFVIRCIPVLTRKNYDHIAEIIKFAKDMGMESVFVDRYEDGGIGSNVSNELKLTPEQFDLALDQMIWARDTYGIDVGWGTAIPSCLNEKLVECGMESDCGAGVTFAAINPNGDVRICNQSMHIYGNLLSDMSFHEIWHQKGIDEFRDLAWTKGTICDECHSLASCLGGCKVDASIEGEYSVDYSIREKQERPVFVDKIEEKLQELQAASPNGNRFFSVNRFTRLHDVYPEKYAVTQFQTVLLDDDGAKILKHIIERGVISEGALKQAFTTEYSEDEIARFVTSLVAIAAIDLS